MCGPAAIPIITAVATAASVANDIKSARKADKNTRSANEAAKRQSEDALRQQDRELNRKNAKAPNVAALFSSNRLASQNQTALSGTGGVNPSSLVLGQNTLLGQ